MTKKESQHICTDCANDGGNSFCGTTEKWTPGLQKWIENNWDNQKHQCKPNAQNCPGWKQKEVI